MATFLEDLWNSIFTPGATPTLLVATNASFGALQAVLFALLLATKSIHFLILSVLSAGLWYAINWFARELQIEQSKAYNQQAHVKERSPEPGSDTETEIEKTPPAPVFATSATVDSPAPAPVQDQARTTTSEINHLAESARRRRSMGDSSGYVSTDSEWEKVSEGPSAT